MNNPSRDSWDKFLKPESLRGSLILASLFIASYETLKDSIIDQLRSFYTHGWDENGPIVSESYEAKVLSLDSKKNPLRGSIAWLKNSHVIDEQDVQTISNLTKHRNEVTHELPKYIAEVGNEVRPAALSEILDLVTKIDRWWIVNVELEIQDEIDPSKVNASEITSGNMLFLRLMIGIATGAQYTELHADLEKFSQTKQRRASTDTE